MVQIVKQHKVSGEIVKIDAKDAWINYLTGTIDARTFSMIKAATEKGSDYYVIGQEGKKEYNDTMTEKNAELKAYCDSRAKTLKALNY